MQKKKQRNFYYLALTLLTLALWVPGFLNLPPTDRDESRFAQASKQMLETGDFITIRNGAVARNSKPIGIYWLQAASAALVGRNPIWPYRMPSLLGGILAVLATFELGLTLFAQTEIAALAAAMLAACLILTSEVHTAKTDAALLGTTTLAMALLARAWTAHPLKTWQTALFWLALGAGILLKGPITPLVIGLAAAGLSLWQRSAIWLQRLRPAWGVPLTLATTAPWFIAIGLATHGKFFADSVGSDLGNKLAGGAESHGGFPGLHLLLLPLLSFPTSLALIAALPSAWAQRTQRPIQFLIAWVLPGWLIFEAVPTKLPHYTLPFYPALFLLAAQLWLQAPTRPPRWALRLGKCLLLLIGAGVAGAAIALPLYLKAPWWLGLPTAATMALVTWLAWHQRIWALPAMALLYTSLLQIELPNIPALWLAPQAEALIRKNLPNLSPQGDGLGVAGYAEPSLMFLAGTHIIFYPFGPQAAIALQQGRATALLVSNKELHAFTELARLLKCPTQTLGSVTGFNYSRGRWVTLTLIVPRPPPTP